MKAFALFLAIMAWGLAPDRFAGRYVLEGGNGKGSELALKTDGQFEYTLSNGAANYTATGKWHISGESVVLNSKIPNAPAFKLVRSTPLRSPDIRVWVLTQNGSPVANLDVTLTADGGEIKARTDSDGMSIFPGATNPKSVVIRIEAYNKDSGPVALNPDDTDFNFVLNRDVIATVPFHGEVLKVNGDTLEMLYWDKTKPMIYRKQ